MENQKSTILGAMVGATAGLALVLKMKIERELRDGERGLLGRKSHRHSDLMPTLDALQEDEI